MRAFAKFAIKCSTCLAAIVTIAGCSAINTSEIVKGDVVTWECGKDLADKSPYPFIPYDYIIQSPGDILGVKKWRKVIYL